MGTGPDPRIQVHHVVQITDDNPQRAGWRGAFVLVTEMKAWGIQGFVHDVHTHQEARQAYIRLKWDQMEYVGPAVLVPGSEGDGDANG